MKYPLLVALPAMAQATPANSATRAQPPVATKDPAPWRKFVARSQQRNGLVPARLLRTKMQGALAGQ